MSEDKRKQRPLHERCFIHERVHPYPSGYVQLSRCTCKDVK